jgi:UDP-2,3-diacylglucosamine pyrophosphatase LpxH
MEPVIIAHLSDLHFGELNSVPVWNTLVNYLNEKVRPHLVLITGDVVNSPEQQLLECAKAELEKLRPRARDNERYRLCPGNHDRFFLGNSAGKKPWILRWFGDSGRNLTRPSHHTLETYFPGGLVLDKDLPFDITLSSNGASATNCNLWKIRVLGCDSSESDTYFAQGAITTKSIDTLRTLALADDTRDIVILMVHHHLMPVSALEREQPSLKSLANVTGMLNAGTALNMLAASQVNLVLHGHEHHPQSTKCQTFDAANGGVVVVGAGSATGTKTLEGCEIRRARFNVLELHSDRTVILREVTGEKGYFSMADRYPVQLLSSEDIRRACFLRTATRREERVMPRSRVTKFFEFGSDRDCVITETRTDWLIGENLVIPTQNRTGTPALATVCLEDGSAMKEFVAKFVPTQSGDNSYTALVELHDAGCRRYDRVTTSWTWEAAGILTEDELITLSDPGEFRRDKKEFVTVDAPQCDLEELMIVLKVPEEYAPDIREIQIWTSNLERPDWEINEVLKKSAQSLGRGLFSLRVPYPSPNGHYTISWPMVPCLEEVRRNSRSLVGDSKSLHESICESLYGQNGLPPDACVAVYLRDEHVKYLKLERVQTRGLAPDLLTCNEANNVLRGAWWGSLRIIAPDENEMSTLFLQGDKYVALLPLRRYGIQTTPATALVRIALQSPFDDLDPSNDAAQVDALRAILARISALW